MKLTITNALVIISAIFTFFAMYDQTLYTFGMSVFPLIYEDYLRLFIQFCLYSFIHFGFIHLLGNFIFLYFFGNPLESLMGYKKYLLFFFLTVIFIGIAILIFSRGITAGMSGFCMAILSYYTLTLFELKNPEYKGGITAILLNIFIGFLPGISMVGHLFGVIFGVLFYIGDRVYKKFI